MLTAIVAIIIFALLVSAHEFGHFIVARLTGVEVSAFSIGFGKVLWEKQDKKGTYITCKCKAIAIDETKYYYRVIGNEEDFEIIKEDEDEKISKTN